MKYILFLLIMASFVFSSRTLGMIPPDSHSGKENKLAVVVSAVGDSIKVKGYYIYVRDGKEYRCEVEKDNAWGWNFTGDYIKKVEMRKVAGNASYRLYVIENGQMLFESRSIQSKKPIVYERKG